jgi:tRNA(Ile)-lysidine synthase
MPIGLAVSGGPDSLALLILACAARPGQVEAATVDHQLRTDSRGEALRVAELCGLLGVPHHILPADKAPPAAGSQAWARALRYRLLARWARNRKLSALVTAHQADDQAELLAMRLNRGCGVRGLAGMRAISPVPGAPGLPLMRPLLGWRRAELEQLCRESGLVPAADPANADPRYERTRVRCLLEAAGEVLDPAALARSASALAEADAGIEWAAEREWRDHVQIAGEAMVYAPSAGIPDEILRRILVRAVQSLASEGPGDLRGRELDPLLRQLRAGETATLRGVRCTGGKLWRFRPAAPRKSAARPNVASGDSGASPR